MNNTNIKISSSLKFYPLSPDRWEDFEQLFGERGACGGCWCMWWRLKRSEFDRQKGIGNKEAMKRLVQTGKFTGILAYSRTKPIGWCSVAPREDFPVLERSRILKRIDDKPVWSIVCFFIERKFRRRGVSVELLKTVIEFVKKWGGSIIEGYPVEPKKERSPDVFVYTGLYSAFLKAGFCECARRSETRPVMRYILCRPGITV